MHGKYLVAVCDILGFSALVQSQPLDLVVKDALGWFSSALNHSIHRGNFPASPPPIRELDGHKHVGIAWFSDTILVYTKEDSDEAVADLLTSVAWLLFETIVEGTTKVRAGISYGDAFIDRANSLYVGEPIIEAYRLQERQQWAGAALTPAACARVPKTGSPGEHARWYVTPWNVPMKDHEPMATLAVNWNRGIHAPSWRLRWSVTSDLPPEPNSVEEQSLYEKYLNTKHFHEAHCHDCKGT